MSYIYIGKIVNTHGVKGELRLLSDFKYKDKIFKKDFNIYIGKDKIKETIVSYRHHKIFDMIFLEGYSNINEVLKYKGQKAYVLKEDIVLNEDEYLNEDLINLEVYIDNKLIGTIKRIDKYPSHDIILIKGESKDYMVPFIKEFINKIDLDNHKIIINNIKGLIE